MSKAVERILSDTAPRRVADAAQKLAGEEMAAIEASLPRALAGDREQVGVYVAAYERLTERMLKAVGEASPGLLAAADEHGRLTLLQGEAMNAPFSAWVGSLDPGRGTALAVVDQLRSSLRAAKPLSRPAKWRLPRWELEEGDVVRFYRAVAAAMEGRDLPLQRIQTVLGLNRTEAAVLFGVRRQALEGWERSGVPAERQAKLASIGAIADLLATQLKADRVPAVARRPAPAYGDRSILEAIAADAEDAVLEALRAGFDWSSGA